MIENSSTDNEFQLSVLDVEEIRWCTIISGRDGNLSLGCESHSMSPDALVKILGGRVHSDAVILRIGSSQYCFQTCKQRVRTQTTTVPGLYVPLIWKSDPLAMWSNKNFRRNSDSSVLNPTIRRVKPVLTYKAFSPVTGCWRTTGC